MLGQRIKQMKYDQTFGSLFISDFGILVLSYFSSYRKDTYSILAQIFPWESFGKHFVWLLWQIFWCLHQKFIICLCPFSAMTHKMCTIIYCHFGTSVSLSSKSRVRFQDKRKRKHEKNGESDYVKEQRAKGPWQRAREERRLLITSQRSMFSQKRLIKTLS